MIANAAFAAGLTVFGIVVWLANELMFLTPYRAFLFRHYGWVIGEGALLLFVNLVAIYYALARWMFLRDTGRKLTHLDRQLTTADDPLDDEASAELEP